MKKFLKKFLVFVLIIPALFLFGACKKKDDGKNSGGTSTQQPALQTNKFYVSFDYNLPEKYVSVIKNNSVSYAVGKSYVLPNFVETEFEEFFDHWENEDGDEVENVSGIKDQTFQLKAIWKGDMEHYLHSFGMQFEFDDDNDFAIVSGISNMTNDVLVIPTYVDNNSKSYTVVGVAENAFKDNKKIKSVVTYAQNLSVENNAFFGTNLETFDFKILSKVGNYAFAQTNIKDAEFSSSLSSFGFAAFSGCTSLESVDFSKVVNTNVVEIPEQAFMDCVKLTEVIPCSQMNTIKTEAFKNCSALSDVSFVSNFGFTKLGNNVFESTAVTSAKISSAVSSIGTGIFDNCEITNLELEQLFYDSNNLGLFAEIFGDLKNSLKTIKLGGSITTIYNYYFQNFAKLETLDMTTCSALETIGNYAFYNCSNLQNINFPTTMKATAFNITAFYNTSWYANQDEVLIIDKSLLFVPTNYDGEDGVVTIAEGVETISTSAFAENKNITKIVIPASLKLIDSQAFYNCLSLQKVEIKTGSKLEKIANRAFYNCSSLTEINLSVCSNFKIIGDNAFFKIGAVENFVIPSSIESIGNKVFAKSSIKTFSMTSPNDTYNVVDGILCESNDSGMPEKLLCCPTAVNIEFLILPSFVNFICGDSFLKNPNLKYIYIQNPSAEVEDFAFDALKLYSTKILVKDKTFNSNNNYLTEIYMLDSSCYDFSDETFVVNSIPYDDIFTYYAVEDGQIYLIEVSVSGETFVVESSKYIGGL